MTLTRRAAGVLAGLRSDALGRVRPGGVVISRSDSDLRWWTWAGYRANATLKATLGEMADEKSLAGLKFSDALPPRLAVATLAARLADLDHARTVLMEPVRFER